MTCGTREKPKKADFVYKGMRCWIKTCTRHTDWLDGEYFLWSSYDIRRYDDDTIFDPYEVFTGKDLDEYSEKEDAACDRIFPYTYGDFDNEL